MTAGLKDLASYLIIAQLDQHCANPCRLYGSVSGSPLPNINICNKAIHTDLSLVGAHSYLA